MNNGNYQQNPYGQQNHNGPQNQYGQYPPPPPFDANAYYARNNAFDTDAVGKSRGIAALLAILLGAFGIQYFYLDKTTAGIICILLTLCTCGIWQILTLIQGVLMLVMSNADFDRKYVYNNATFPLF